MPLAPLPPPGSDDEGMPDWLQRMLGGWMSTAGGPGFPRSIVGQSMGYPAQGGGAQLAAAGPPAPGGADPINLAGLGTAPGMSMGGGNPGVPGALANPHGDAPTDVMSPADMYRQQGLAQAPAPPPQGPSAVPPQGPPGYLNSTSAMAPGPTPSADPRNYDAMLNRMTGNSGPSLADMPAGYRYGRVTAAPLPPPRPTRTAGAPNLGYYQGDKFKLLPQSQVSGVRQHPYVTALNLASLFGGR